MQEFYELRESEANDIRMMFRANPKPTEGQWSINSAIIAIGSESLDSKYKSTFIEDGVRSLKIHSTEQCFLNAGINHVSGTENVCNSPKTDPLCCIF